jgi:hypothetical protein
MFVDLFDDAVTLAELRARGWPPSAPDAKFAVLRRRCPAAREITRHHINLITAANDVICSIEELPSCGDLV